MYQLFSLNSLNWIGLERNGTDENGLCVSIFLKNMGWCLGVIRKLHNDECLIYIFTGKIQNGNLSIF